MSTMSSEPHLYRSKSNGSKPFAPIERSSTAGPASSYKLSSRVRNILSTELQRSSSGGSDASVQPMKSRRRFQRRGSKSPSMFKALSTGHLMTDLLKIDAQKNVPVTTTDVLIQSMETIPNDTNRSCRSSLESSLGESMTSFSLDLEENMMEF